MTYRIHALHIVQVIMAIMLVIVAMAIAILASGCRTAGPQVRLDACRDCTVEVRDSATDAAQGKSVPVKALSDLAASAAQTGDAAATLADDSAQTAEPATIPSPAATGETEATPPVDGGESPPPAPAPSPSSSQPSDQ